MDQDFVNQLKKAVNEDLIYDKSEEKKTEKKIRNIFQTVFYSMVRYHTIPYRTSMQSIKVLLFFILSQKREGERESIILYCYFIMVSKTITLLNLEKKIKAK